MSSRWPAYCITGEARQGFGHRRTHATLADYFQKLKAGSSGLPIDWISDSMIGHYPSPWQRQASGIYPFPMAHRERRSSLIAMLANKACVLTTHGAHTPDAMRSCVVEVASPAKRSHRPSL